MSGFTRDTYHYGDQLVYEALHSKWDHHHATYCGCGQGWITTHAIPAGFTIVREGGGFTVLIGPGLTENVDETELTTNVLWEAVTSRPGSQDRFEDIRVVDRGPEAKASLKASSEAHYAGRRKRAAQARIDRATIKQIEYLKALAAKIDVERFDIEFAKATKGTDIATRDAEEKPGRAMRRLTRAAARKLIAALVENR